MHFGGISDFLLWQSLVWCSCVHLTHLGLLLQLISLEVYSSVLIFMLQMSVRDCIASVQDLGALRSSSGIFVFSRLSVLFSVLVMKLTLL